MVATAALQDADVMAFFTSDMPAADWLAADPAPERTELELIVAARESLGRKFTGADLANNPETGAAFYDAAAAWLPGQTAADFGWLRDLAQAFVRGGGLSDGQAAGVLNCMVAAARRDRPVRQIMAAHDLTLGERFPAPATLDDDDRAAEAWLLEQASSVSRGYYTVVSPDDHHHRTFKVSKWSADRYRPGQNVRWIGYLNGANNEGDYVTCAKQTDDGTVTLLKAYDRRTDLAEELATLFGEDVAGRTAMRQAYALASTRCSRCNRLLTHPDSVRDGLGPECAGKVGY